MLTKRYQYFRCCMHPRDVKHTYSFCAEWLTVDLMFCYVVKLQNLDGKHISLQLRECTRTHTLQLPRSLVQMSLSLKHERSSKTDVESDQIGFKTINMSRSFQEFDTILERWGTCRGDRSCPTLNAPRVECEV